MADAETASGGNSEPRDKTPNPKRFDTLALGEPKGAPSPFPIHDGPASEDFEMPEMK